MLAGEAPQRAAVSVAPLRETPGHQRRGLARGRARARRPAPASPGPRSCGRAVGDDHRQRAGDQPAAMLAGPPSRPLDLALERVAGDRRAARTRARPPRRGGRRTRRARRRSPAAGRSAAQPRCRRAARPRSSCGPRGRAGPSPSRQSQGTSDEVGRARDRQQLGRPLDGAEGGGAAGGERRAPRLRLPSGPGFGRRARRRAGAGSAGRRSRRRSPRAPRSRRSGGSRATPPSCRRPACRSTPSISTQGMQPASVSTVKRQNGIRATPAGSEMKVRMIGSMRVKNTVASPWRSNQRSAQSRCLRLMWMRRFFSSSSMRP